MYVDLIDPYVRARGFQVFCQAQGKLGILATVAKKS